MYNIAGTWRTFRDFDFSPAGFPPLINVKFMLQLQSPPATANWQTYLSFFLNDHDHDESFGSAVNSIAHSGSKPSTASNVCPCMFLHKTFCVDVVSIRKYNTNWLNISSLVCMFRFWYLMTLQFPCDLQGLISACFHTSFFATFLLKCAHVHALSYHICAHVSVCVHATVTTVIDRSPCRASCHVEKGNTDSERDREEDWRGNLPSDNCIALHLLLLTLTCRSQSLLLLCTKHFLRTVFSQNTLKQAQSLL